MLPVWRCAEARLTPYPDETEELAFQSLSLIHIWMWIIPQKVPTGFLSPRLGSMNIETLCERTLSITREVTVALAAPGREGFCCPAERGRDFAAWAREGGPDDDDCGAPIIRGCLLYTSRCV